MIINQYHTQGNFDINKLMNLHLLRFDDLKVDETLHFAIVSKTYFGETDLT